MLPVAALAQSGDSASSDSWWRPGAGRVAVGLNLGRSHFHLDCAAAFPCDKRDTYWSLYGRHMMDDRWGSQLSLVNMGEADRGGGGTRAYGLDLSLVGKVPLTDSLGAYGKLGAIWGHTRVNAAAVVCPERRASGSVSSMTSAVSTSTAAIFLARTRRGSVSSALAGNAWRDLARVIAPFRTVAWRAAFWRRARRIWPVSAFRVANKAQAKLYTGILSNRAANAALQGSVDGERTDDSSFGIAT